jgi:hypothetical protein
MKRFTITASVGLVAIAFAIAGCGGSAATSAPAASSSAQSAAPAASAASGASAGGQASTGASQAAPASAGTAAAGAGQPVKVCDVLPVATVASIDGQSLTQGTEQDTPALQSYGCYYGGADLDGVTVTVAYGAASTFDTLLQVMQAGSNAKVINGLGDKAFSTSIGVYALFGDVQIEVSGLQSDDAAATLIKTLQPKL